MRILLDITHPAHVHFFRNAIRQWQAEGDAVLVTSRDKDITLQLLDQFEIEHQCLSVAKRGVIGLGLELSERGFKLVREVQRFKPHVAAAIAGTFVVYGCLPHRIPTVVFYDTEHARVSNAITYPLAAAVVTPQAYEGEIGKKHIRYNGFQELAYTHPRVFTPDATALAEEGLKQGEPFSIVRLVNWQASHDIGDSGVQDLQQVVTTLGQYGRVILSSESPLPDDLQSLQMRGSYKNMLHLQAFARLLYGESATMASECAMLGVPALFVSSSKRGYINTLQNQYDMVYAYHDSNRQAQSLAKAAELLADPETPLIWQRKREKMLTELIDVTQYIVDTVRSFARQ
jgi:uncharacterized protein